MARAPIIGGVAALAGLILVLCALLAGRNPSANDNARADDLIATNAGDLIGTGVDAETFRAMLAAQAERNRRDGRAWMLLARADFAANRYASAAESYAQAVAGSANVARDPQAWCEYADALGMARGGSLEGKPRELIMRALAIDPNHPRALEMAGSAALDEDDAAAAVEHWRMLVVQLPPRSPERRELVVALARAEELAASRRINSPVRP